MATFLPAEVIFQTSENGVVRPLRFRVRIDAEEIVVRIQRVISTDERRKPDHSMVFVVECILYDTVRRIKLRFEVAAHKWFVIDL